MLIVTCVTSKRQAPKPTIQKMLTVPLVLFGIAFYIGPLFNFVPLYVKASILFLRMLYIMFYCFSRIPAHFLYPMPLVFPFLLEGLRTGDFETGRL